MSYTPEQVMQALETIERLLPEYPTDIQLRETHKPSEGHQPPPPPDHLPFGLNKTMPDSWTRPLTEYQIDCTLTAIAFSWAHDLREGKQITDPLAYLKSRVVLASEYLHRFQRDAETLTKVAYRVEQNTGHGIEPTGKTCPYCNQEELTRTYTDEGISDMMHCPGCGQQVSPEQYTKYAVLYARYGEKDITLTQTDAAIVLGENIKTINARVKRRNIQPIIGTGRNAKYYLDDLKKKQN
ncbi:hypothetical protein [uncultured Mobiluncus sp.]|uniref:hypothetical protein n=1 Tax=uncultured Mobiluncus sp. TaxID=293425 RepID=UPI0026159EC3|nr:hypothetical protein [uncultured Mobiluncus sp.]